MTPDVFISYSSSDKNAAYTVCSILEQNGARCWIAPRDITPGHDFSEAIIDGIKSSKIFILVYSSNSNTSAQVIREVDRAVHHGLSIITLRLEDVPLSKQLEYYLSSVHWLDAMIPPLEKHVDRLTEIVKSLTGKNEYGTADIDKEFPKRDGQGDKVFKRRKSWQKLITGVFLLFAFLTYFYVIKPGVQSDNQLPDKSIAVLPFKNLSNDPEQEYFVEGMLDEILDRIFKIGELKVISRTSSMRYRNSELSLKEIARDLGVTHILEGSVRKSGNNVRITVQLIDAGSDIHLWSDVYDRGISDIFSIQSDIAVTIARELRAVITPHEKALIEKPHTASSEAYEAWLKGMYSWRKLTSADLDVAMQYFELALQKDPEFGLAYAGIAHVWTARSQLVMTRPIEAAAKAEEYLNKAIESDNTSAEIFYILATHRVWGMYDWEGGETAFRKAIEINPNHAEAHAYYSHLLMILRRPDEAVEHMEKALDLDPYSSLIWGLYGVELGFLRRYEDAIAAYRKSKELDPTQPVGTINYFLYVLGREEEAFSEFRKNFTNPDYLKAADEGYKEGGYKGAQKRVADERVKRAQNINVSPVIIANNYAIAGEYDLSLYWLEKGYEARDPGLPYVSTRLWFSEIIEDIRFQDLCRKLNLPY
jgi:adenylate cyclase